MKEIYLNEYNILMTDRIYLPSSSGMLRAYAESESKTRKHYRFMPFLFIRDKPSQIFKDYNNPAVVGFSSSLWNHQLNLTLAQMVKEAFPNCLIVFGGPHVPNNAEDFFKQHPFIDVVVHGEGEGAFTELLSANLETRDFKHIPGITYRNPNSGNSIKNQDRPLLKDINILPSPYLSGLYDDLIKKGDFQYQVIFETIRGCPFTCSYCYWGHNNKGPLREFSLERLKEEITWMAKHKIQFVFGADSNFGMFPHDIEVSKLFVEIKKKFGYPKIFRVCYGKNAEENNFQVAKLLNDNGLTKGVTLSRQSNSPVVLKNVKRMNISMDVYERLQKRYHEASIPVYTEFILGLPGETYDSFVEGIEKTITAGLHDQLNIFFCEALPNTDITDPVYMKQHGIKLQRIEVAEFHATKRKLGEVIEYDDIIVATSTMPQEDLKKTAMFAWMIQILHGLKLGFFVCAYLYHDYKVKYSDFCKYILAQAKDKKHYPVFNQELKYYEQYLKSLFTGGSLCVFLNGLGNISWDIDEASCLHFSTKITSFYNELFAITLKYLKEHKIGFNNDILKEVFLYQKARVPNYRPITKTKFEFQYNIPEYFDNFLNDKKIKIKKSPQKLILDSPRDFKGNKEEFAKQIVWFSRKDKNIIHQVRWE